MEMIEFWKMQGSGNDFILIDNRDQAISQEVMPQLVLKACRRRTSVGADGVIFVTRSEKYDFAWRYFNADGGEVEMCGNGSRCVCRFAYLKGIAGPKMTFETLAGPVSGEVNGRFVKVLMPLPTQMKLDIPVEKDPGWKSIDFVNTGVPHVVVILEDIETYPVVEQGRALRYHKYFAPDGTNANFVEVLGPNELGMRTYERGVEDETLACGTGAVASSIVCAERGLVKPPVKVKTRSGEVLTISFKKEGDGFQEVWMEGSTTIVYEGKLHREAIE
ncbi:MAG: diaminopimelate epimerase [Deltaproteobacteria bacterium]|nr:MAG: diaminopimelate epimerase [Deltaproteobacteria bacterium]RLB77245.1 MAG: diaminopimelate epimerase [Deltaproteobacteria bacterium]